MCDDSNEYRSDKFEGSLAHLIERMYRFPAPLQTVFCRSDEDWSRRIERKLLKSSRSSKMMKVDQQAARGRISTNQLQHTSLSRETQHVPIDDEQSHDDRSIDSFMLSSFHRRELTKFASNEI